MNKIYRNIALVTGVFMLSLAAMLIVNYFQISGTSPLENELLETLKGLNESGNDNPALQEQIRQLDLLTRKAYFIHENHLKMGMYILLAMALVVVGCLRMYYREFMNLPEKELDVMDEWLSKSVSRKYIGWGTAATVVVALAFGVMSSPTIKDWFKNIANNTETAVADDIADEDLESTLVDNNSANQETSSTNVESISGNPEESSTIVEDISGNQESSETLVTETTKTEDATTTPVEAVEELPVPKITSNGLRGNLGSSSSTARGIPTSWDIASGKNIAWQINVPRQGYNTPVLNGRNIFVSAADEEARELYCYDIYNGELKWSVKADNIPGSPSTMPKVTGDTGLAASSVATNGKQVCAIFATGDLICCDMDGKRLWAKNLGLPDNHYGYGSSLLMSGNTLYVQYLNNGKAQIMALSTTSGNQIWNVTTKDRISWSSPILAKAGDKNILVVNSNPAVTAYDPKNGAELWRIECMSGEVGASPVANGGTVYAASEYSKCIAIDGATGEQKWEATDYLPECSSPAASAKYVYVATSYGVVCAYDAETGELKQEHDLGSTFYSSPMIADGKVWLMGNDGMAYVFSAGDDFALINKFQTGEDTFATPAFSDGMMIIRSNKSMYCVTKK